MRTSSHIIRNMRGVDMHVDAELLPSEVAGSAINRSFRSGLNSTRPPFKAIRLVFDSPADEELFRTGNVQGFHFYRRTSSRHESGLLVAVGGVLFFGRVTGAEIAFRALWRGFEPTAVIVDCAQGYEQAYLTDGITFPVAWDGLSESVRELRGVNQMPITTLVAYTQGRIVCADSLDRVVVSDHFQSQGAGVRTAMDSFLENTYFTGGFMTAVPELGAITGFAPVPDDGREGTGALAVLCERGVGIVDLRTPREQWTDISVLSSGIGCVGPWAWAAHNGELYLRDRNGLFTLSQARSNSGGLSINPISRPLGELLARDATFTRAIPTVAFNDWIFTGTWATAQPGGQRTCAALAVFDTRTADGGSGRWEGLWTAQPFTGLAVVEADGAERLMASVVGFGGNRIVELDRVGVAWADTYDDGSSVPIRGLWTTGAIFGEPNTFTHPKILLGANRLAIRHRGPGTLRVEFTNDRAEKWVPLTNFDIGPAPDLSGAHWWEGDVNRLLYTSTPSETDCDPLSRLPSRLGRYFLFRFDIHGRVAFRWTEFLLGLTVDSNTAVAQPSPNYAEDYSPLSPPPP